MEDKGTRVGPHGVSGTLYGAEGQPAPWQDGAALIAAERERQRTEEGYTAAHDDGHAHEIALAGACYAQLAAATVFRGFTPEEACEADAGVGGPDDWPWRRSSWRPTGDPVRDLTKAGALIAAAIDAELAKRT